MYRKLISSGNILEIYEFEKPPNTVRRKSRKRRKDTRRYLPSLTRRKDNIHRLRNTFRRLVWANSGGAIKPTLITQTMYSVISIQLAYKAFSSFIHFLRSEYGSDFRYVCVPEFQKRGAVHFHSLFWGLPESLVMYERDTRLLQRTWGYGYVDVVSTDGSSKLGTYLAKYMSKAMQDSRLLRAKAYVASRNCLRSVQVRSEAVVDLFREALVVDKTLVRDATYPTQWLGSCHYQLFSKD